jgi:hypothetical protein
MTDYPHFVAQGYDCGSAPTESQCGTTTARAKGPHMRWDADNAEAMLALAALDHSRLGPQPPLERLLKAPTCRLTRRPQIMSHTGFFPRTPCLCTDLRYSRRSRRPHAGPDETTSGA